MSNVNPLYLFIGAVVIALAAMAAVVVLQVTGHKEDVSTVLTFAVSLIGSILAALGVSAHQKNVDMSGDIIQNQAVALRRQANIEQKVENIEEKV